MSPRPPLPIGTYGKIACAQVAPSRYKARARYRGDDGVVRPVSRYGQTKSAAENALRAALAEMQRTGSTLTVNATVNTLAAAWLDEIDGRHLAQQTRDHYRGAVERYVKPELGALRIREATTKRCDAAIARVRERSGAGAATSMRKALNGIFGLAVRHDLLTASPVRETARVTTGRKKPRALTIDETDDLRDKLRADQRAVDFDLPDLVEWMLYTGMRIGEAMAVRAAVLAEGTVTVNATIVRVKGRGLVIQERPKSAAGVRTLPLPSLAVAMLERRRGELRFSTGPVTFLDERGEFRVEDDPGVVFPAPLRRSLRDPSNTSGDLREVLDRLGYKWVTSHTFRKTAITRLEEAGFSPRQVADFAGHSQPSMTMNVYFGRASVDPGMASALDR